MLSVYKASAGSGKTFQLVVEYLRLLQDNPNNYKRILAVTFTNKATNEMKSRILEQLYKLANNEKSEYLNHLVSTRHGEEYVRNNARQVLKNILHDYNRFSISTIDSFTQRIIKSFNRDLGISPSFTVELDSNMIMDEAVDRLLSSVSKNKKLLNWLRDFSREKIEENYSQRINDDIKSLGEELFKENFQLFFPEDSESVYSHAALEQFNDELFRNRKKIESSYRGMGKKGMKLIGDNGFTVDDFLSKGSGPAGFIKKVSEGEFKEPTNTAVTASQNVDKWYRKNHESAGKIRKLVELELRPLLDRLISYYNDNIHYYNTTVIVLKQLRMLGILSDLKEEVMSVAREKGVLQISDFNILLSKIIDQSDTPFIYEKTGNFYKHFMLDEFQDTSALQWGNFKPLVQNSLAEGNKNLVVGDVKQSIYRWRNSDWKILGSELKEDIPSSQYNEIPLKNNWRSDKNVIDFNNAIFEKLKANFESVLTEEIPVDGEDYKDKFNSIYDSFFQVPGNQDSPQKGHICARFLPEEDFEALSVKKLVEDVKILQDRGIPASEIAILIRKNKEGNPIIEEFLKASKREENKKYVFSVISNESLFLHASMGVNFVINIINLLVEPGDEIAKVALLNLWTSWLKPELVKRNLNTSRNTGHSELPFTITQEEKLSKESLTAFENELARQLEVIRDKILLSSLDEIITMICDEFGLFEIESEQPFLQTLTDNAGELKSTEANDLVHLLHWWNEKGLKTSVQVNENVDSIRLITVHKSKGLEFKAVLIPFLNWNIFWESNKAPILWCRPATEPFSRFPLLPVRAGSKMAKSDFNEEYYIERVSYAVDTLNLVYVAFTRAKSVLIINSKKSSGKGKSLNNLLQKSLNDINQAGKFSTSLIQEEDQFQFGELHTSEEAKKIPAALRLHTYQFNDFKERLRLKVSGEEFIREEDGTGKSKRNTGKMIHEILSETHTKEDFAKAVAKALNEGKTDEQEAAGILRAFSEKMNDNTIKKWFDGSKRVFNERSLLKGNMILRPDRIMISEKEIIVVDYKTGESKSYNNNKQVRRYSEVLKETTEKKVTGYLWYIKLNEIEKVCEI